DHSRSDRVLGCGLRPHVNRTSESGSIGGIKVPHNLLAIHLKVSIYPVTVVKFKTPVDVGDNVQAPREDFALLSTGVGSSFCGTGTDSELVASSDEAACALLSEPVADLSMEPEAWANSDPEAWLDSEPDVDPISVCSSSD
ncbi:hypothetical protein MTR67_023119, partial [Solanum verrucosum]